MTSDEIKNENKLDSQYFWIWLKEIAYQLAVMNEQRHLNVTELERFEKNQALGSKVGAVSDTEVREGCPACGAPLRGKGPREQWNMLGELARVKGQLDAANQHVKILQEASQHSTVEYLASQIRLVADAVLEVAPEKLGTGSACAVAAEMIRGASGAAKS